MGSVFSLDPLYSYISSFLNPQMPPRHDPGFTFPPELTQLIQQQNTLMQLLVQNQNQGNNNNNPPPPPPPPIDHLARFLRLNPPVFSSSTEPIVADDWLRKTARELTMTGCTDAKKVKLPHISLKDPQHHGGRISPPLSLSTLSHGTSFSRLSVLPMFQQELWP